MEECLAVAVAVAAITASSPRPPIAKPSQGAGSVGGWWWVEDGSRGGGVEGWLCTTVVAPVAPLACGRRSATAVASNCAEA